MAWIIYVPNPFNPHEHERQEVDLSVSLREWIAGRFPESRDFPTPTICLLNGEPLLREHWDHRVGPNDIVTFIAVQGFFIALIIAIVLAVVLAVMMPVPEQPAATPTSDPVFTIKGAQNSARLGEPIECCYGRNRVYPSYAARPYYRYLGNDHFQFALFCIGHGHFDVEQILIGDTDIDSFDEVTYEVVEPGAEVTIFPTDVYTAEEVGGQQLFPSNHPEYTDWTGPFIAVPSGYQSRKIELDISFPKGFYRMTDTGSVTIAYSGVVWQARKIDDSGNPIGDYFTLSNKVFTFATTNPFRISYTVTVPLGRYEVRARNTGTWTDSSRYLEDVNWDGLRSWVDYEHDYGETTLLAVRMRATNNLNDRTAQQFSVICTRKLPVLDSAGEWSSPIATRSIVWAFVDLFRSSYGGRVTSPSYYDWETLLALDELYTERGDNFDWVFREPSTVWEAARTIARAGRAVPLIVGSLISMKRDSAQSVPVAMFSPENMVAGTFEWNVKLWEEGDYDSLRVEYTEPETLYQPETVVIALPGSTSDTPEDVRFMGIQSREQAYREGLYALACRRYQRQNVTFETGLEGFIPTYGDLIAVSHDVPDWGVAGIVIDATRVAADQYLVVLSQPLSWGESYASFRILFRKKDGSIIGPLVVEPGSSLMEAVVTSVDDIDFLLDGTTEPCLYLFGPVDRESTLCRVLRADPQGGERIRITAMVEASEVHTFDELTPPSLGTTEFIISIPDSPSVTGLELVLHDTTALTLLATWKPSLGARSYVVQSSVDEENWTDVGATAHAFILLPAIYGRTHIRVAAINVGQGPWATTFADVGTVGIIDVAVPFEELEVIIGWKGVLNATGYQVKVYDNTTGSDPALKRTETLIAGTVTYTYNYDKAVIDGNVNRALRFEVDTIFREVGGTAESPTGYPSVKDVENTSPTSVTGFTINRIDNTNPAYCVYRISWEVPELDDLQMVKIWVSADPNFDVNQIAPEQTLVALSPGWANVDEEYETQIAKDSDGHHPVMYCKVGLFDVWGEEISSTNITSRGTIPAL